MTASTHTWLFAMALVAVTAAPGLMVAALCTLQRRCAAASLAGDTGGNVTSSAPGTYGIDRELTRKAAHVGTGLVCLTFPWLFAETWPVLAWSGATTAALLAIRWIPALQRVMGGGIYVDRISLGEMYFPISIGVMFWLAHGEWLLYLIPVLTLTVADAVGAVVGVRYGLHRYKTQEGEKSFEGSLAFFSVAFLTTHVPLLLFSPVGRAECLLIGVVVGLIIMLVEAISWRGLDNLFIPVGTFYILQLYIHLSAAELVIQLVVLTSLALLSIVCRNRTTLSDNALMAASLSAFGLWALGAWPYLVSPLLLFVMHIFLPTFSSGLRPMLNLYAVSRVVCGAYLHLFVALAVGLEHGWLPFHLCLACSTGNMVAARLRVVQREMSLGRVVWTAWLTTWIAFAPAVPLMLSSAAWPVALVMMAAGLWASIALFARYWSPVEPRVQDQARQWVVESVIAPVAACTGWIPALMLWFQNT
ncbi:hypothetical protein DB346_11990 [Verrucomicrobia bacterium LW23]|nr:hypothetical protein DB346_11990 [Verrucomicrobia bacterium LW23]